MATVRKHLPDEPRPEQGESPFRLTVEWRTGPRTRAWDELWRWLLADAPGRAADEGRTTSAGDGHE